MAHGLGRILGEAVAPFRGRVVLATKFGWNIDLETGEQRPGLNSRPTTSRQLWRGCSGAYGPIEAEAETVKPMADVHLTPKDRIGDVLRHPAFQGYARMLLPWDDRATTRRYSLRRWVRSSRTTATFSPR